MIIANLGAVEGSSGRIQERRKSTQGLILTKDPTPKIADYISGYGNGKTMKPLISTGGSLYRTLTLRVKICHKRRGIALLIGA
jgi:hypothetical protein